MELFNVSGEIGLKCCFALCTFSFGLLGFRGRCYFLGCSNSRTTLNWYVTGGFGGWGGRYAFSYTFLHSGWLFFCGGSRLGSGSGLRFDGRGFISLFRNQFIGRWWWWCWLIGFLLFSFSCFVVFAILNFFLAFS